MTKPVFIESAKAFVVNEKNEMLVLTISEYKARPDRSFKPDFPGGLVDPGENHLMAVRRELVEETGVHLDEAQLQMVYAQTAYYPLKNESVTKYAYIARLNETPEVTLSWEHSSHSWVPVADVLSTIEVRPFYKDALEYCFAHELL